MYNAYECGPGGKESESGNGIQVRDIRVHGHGRHAPHIQAVNALHPMRGDDKLELCISMYGVLQMTAVICTPHAYHTQAVTGIAAHLLRG